VKFQYQQYLLLLLIIPLLAGLYFYVLAKKKKIQTKIGDKHLVNQLTANYSVKNAGIKFILFVAAIAAGIAALANLRRPLGSEKVNRNGIDIMIALDVSRSMLAQDVKPTRLDRAKQALSKLIDKLSNDRIGIVIFAGKAYLQMPLTGDHGAAKMYLSSASPDAVPTQGTVIGDALKMCFASFTTKEKKYKSVILISDGEDHDEGALQTAGQMADEGVVINTIGIGSPDGAPIIDAVTNEAKKDEDGNTVISKLNEDELKKIAEKGKGIYQLFTNSDEVAAKIDTQLAGMGSRTITEDSLVSYETFYQYFLIAAIIFLLVEFFLSEKKRRLKLAGYLLPAAVFFSSAVHAQTENKLIKKGNDAYNKKEFENAANNYNAAVKKNPLNATAQFNLGNALYKTYKTDDAVAAFDKAAGNTKEKESKANAFYNKGVVLQNAKKLPECIDAYKNALKLNPADEDARQNLQKALLQQKQQQQKENKRRSLKKMKSKRKNKNQKTKKKIISQNHSPLK
jgi:Ca-activated chloride channel family protein